MLIPYGLGFEVFICTKKLPLSKSKLMPKRIAVFASGSGSNFQNITKWFKEKSTANVVLLASNKPNSKSIQKALDLGVHSYVFNKETLTRPSGVLAKLIAEKIDFVVLAGFLLKIPEFIIQVFPNKIINIHPALLPKFGGKGMYGEHVHRAVIESREKESGITIHYVNEGYDEGNVILQARCPVSKDDTPGTLAAKIQVLEHNHFPIVVDQIIQKL